MSSEEDDWEQICWVVTSYCLNTSDSVQIESRLEITSLSYKRIP